MGKKHKSVNTEADKVAIIGCGNVGATTAFTLLIEGIANELVLLSRTKEKAVGEKLDLEHGLPFLEHTRIIATDDYQDIVGSDVVVITAGIKQKPGQTRLDVAGQNTKIIETIIPQILHHAPDAVIVIVSNPVDVLTYKAATISKGHQGKIFGTGTTLDTARFRFHLSEFLKVNPRSIHTYILGEHGDSSFPALSNATVGGQPIAGFPNYSKQKAEEAFKKAQTAAYKIINAKGATFYAIAVVVARIVANVLRDSHSVLPVSVPLTDYYGHSGVALSVPCVIGRNGIEKVIHLPLSTTERKLLTKSVHTLKKYL